MSDLETWVARGVVTALVGACSGIFLRMRTVEKKLAVAEKGLEGVEGRDSGAGEIAALKDEVHGLRLCMERNFVRREDWVPHTSRVIGALEEQARTLGRLEGRMGQGGRDGTGAGA